MSKKKEPLRLDQVLGMNLERIRATKGWSQDEVASRGWQVGLPWTRSTITALEGGRRTLSVSELVLLALTLDTSVAELMAGRGHAGLGDGSELALADVRSVLAGVQDNADVRKRIRRVRHQKYERAMQAVSGEAEQKAARNLGVTAQTIAEVSFDLWGRSLTDERDARVEQEGSHLSSPRSVQALRGHITRQLLRDIESLITSNPDQFPPSEEHS
jgi:transcriptional regulator with XRE-family HTH domain